MSFRNDDGQFSSDPENLFSSSTVESEHSYTTGKSTKLGFAIGTLLFSNFCPPPPPPLQTIAVYLRVHLGMLYISCKEKWLHILKKLDRGEL